MTALLPDFASLPVQRILDGELVAFGDNGLPSFDRRPRRILHRQKNIPVPLIVFDMLDVEAVFTMHQPYKERRRWPPLGGARKSLLTGAALAGVSAVWRPPRTRSLITDGRNDGVVGNSLRTPKQAGEQDSRDRTDRRGWNELSSRVSISRPLRRRWTRDRRGGTFVFDVSSMLTWMSREFAILNDLGHAVATFNARHDLADASPGVRH